MAQVVMLCCAKMFIDIFWCRVDFWLWNLPQSQVDNLLGPGENRATYLCLSRFLHPLIHCHVINFYDAKLSYNFMPYCFILICLSRGFGWNKYFALLLLYFAKDNKNFSVHWSSIREMLTSRYQLFLLLHFFSCWTS